MSCTPTNWTDAIGNTCQDYSDKEYCNIEGLYGDGWATDNGTFDNWRSNGYTAKNCTTCDCDSGLTLYEIINCHIYIKKID